MQDASVVEDILWFSIPLIHPLTLTSWTLDILTNGRLCFCGVLIRNHHNSHLSPPTWYYINQCMFRFRAGMAALGVLDPKLEGKSRGLRRSKMRPKLEIRVGAKGVRTGINNHSVQLARRVVPGLHRRKAKKHSNSPSLSRHSWLLDNNRLLLYPQWMRLNHSKQ